jgi:hypothetical protein
MAGSGVLLWGFAVVASIGDKTIIDKTPLMKRIVVAVGQSTWI